ncbi:MAG: RNA ligase family protein [Bacilli bacterium]|nr:RNA ligase family protein [Bacilli bacterium]
MSLINEDFSPMLLGETKKPFNDKEYLFEIKIDGVRALFTINNNKLIIKNKLGIDITYRYPEFQKLKFNKNIIFDGEIAALVDGKPSFEKLKARMTLKNVAKIKKISKSIQTVFLVFDIIYENKDLTSLPLIKRKDILNKYPNNDLFIKLEYILEKGHDLFKLSKNNNLEGIVAKKTDSLYYPSRRVKEWIKIKNWLSSEFIILGYKEDKDKYVATLLIGEKVNKEIKYLGTISIGKRKSDYQIIKSTEIDNKPIIKKDGYTSIKPVLKCIVEYMERTKSGKLRQPHFRGLKKR